ncbi:RNase H1/viroplasmin domain-containing protein [Neobacillus sp. NRS-1170]|uniref:RNase H1/viroplasmin domain-containing protein n=1 Tax=Neobacillus sp. NRS-1170 TaxID=3233898 RepID=UPI003D2DFD09
MKNRIYAIKKGKKPGIYNGNWKQIQNQYIKGFSNPVFKRCASMEEAEEYMKAPISGGLQKRQQNNKPEHHEMELIKDNITYSDKNPNHLALRTVLLVITGHQKIHEMNKPGSYRYLLIDEQKEVSLRLVNVSGLSNTSVNRSIILGIIRAVGQLQKACRIKLISNTTFGYKKMLAEKKSPNSDLLKELKQLLLNKGHVLEVKINYADISYWFNRYKMYEPLNPNRYVSLK